MPSSRKILANQIEGYFTSTISLRDLINSALIAMSDAGGSTSTIEGQIFMLLVDHEENALKMHEQLKTLGRLIEADI